jgi:hypothetical protein
VTFAGVHECAEQAQLDDSTWKSSKPAQVPANMQNFLQENVARMQHTGHVSAWLDLLEKITGGVT